MATLIECDSLSYRYEQSSVWAVKDVSFTVDEGDYICVVGENGSGKSTLIRMVIGLIKPMGGGIAFKGIGHNEIGYLPQQAPVQSDFPASVMEVVLTGRLNKKGFLPFLGKSDAMAAEANLERLGALGLRRRAYRELSGGQRQRVLLARALCASEKLLVLDEPVTGLDPLAQSEMYRIIRELNEGGLTVLMVSHDVAGAVRAAGRILHMDTEALFFGNTDRYLLSEPGRGFLSGVAPRDIPPGAPHGADADITKDAHPKREGTSDV
ncbi:MAG: ABC transporter ATP-binding protein [Clostridiales Family XIII bacterium]|jgi:zinc transport system ATP-binding protein|nr:ABC transporter ATP-binding protein [Clostridiales Family XIII bacterium]